MQVNGWKIGDAYWKASHQSFYCVVVHPGGRREDRRLDSNADKADTARAALITAAQQEGTPSVDFVVRDLCNAFLEHSEANNRPATYKWYKHLLKSFCSTIPAGLKVRGLKPHHVVQWLTLKYPATGNTNTRHGAVAAIKRVLNWATVEMGYFDRNPLAKLKKPPKVPRAGCLTREQWAEVLSHFKPGDPFREFLEFMLQTGCRPQEARTVAARHIDWKAAKVHFADGEVLGKKGERDILLTDAALAILQKGAAIYPEGPVMRNEDGRPWTKSAINCRFQRLKTGKKKLPFNAHAYLARHSVAVDMLEAGASAGATAAVLGHKDAVMILTTYGKHIDQREQHLREALARATS